jgi:hypothetical protein
MVTGVHSLISEKLAKTEIVTIGTRTDVRACTQLQIEHEQQSGKQCFMFELW